MKLVLDIDLENSKPVKGDIIAFDGVKWVCLTHDKAFSCENKKIQETNNNVEMLRAEIKDLTQKINILAKALKER